MIAWALERQRQHNTHKTTQLTKPQYSGPVPADKCRSSASRSRRAAIAQQQRKSSFAHLSTEKSD